MKTNSSVHILSILIDNKPYFCIIDNQDCIIHNPRVFRVLERYKTYFENFEKLIIKDNINYISLLDLINSVNKALNKLGENEIVLDKDVINFIEFNKYAITEHQVAGGTIKNFDSRWQNEIETFKEILVNEIYRPLMELQIHASFFLTKMKRAANFSVPGAGKTAMMYGSFAFLSSSSINLIDRILIVCPINAFEAWKTEFIEVFQDKKEIKFMNLRDPRYNEVSNIRFDWGNKNVIVINYESLERKVRILNELIDNKTMLVFDEVHRVKGINGKRAKAALKLGKTAQYHYVLTGTPIPNSYKDIYNFLHLLYDNEYDTYFGWDVNDLDNPNPNDINNKVFPFFWRTNKDDLKVPKADNDELLIVSANEKQLNLAKIIHENETNILSLYIRLLQASTNPELVLEKIDYYDLGLLDDEFKNEEFNKLIQDSSDNTEEIYQKFNLHEIESEKFNAGINLILKLVNEGKKVIVWGMFINTMRKIVKNLKHNNISVNLVYGGTEKEQRVSLINDFRDGDVQVLVTNPNTLGESISLHKSVHDAVYFEFNFNLTFMLQSRDRIHRLGLKENQYTRYYYLMTAGDKAHDSFIDNRVYLRLKEKEKIMLNAIEGNVLLPEVTDDYLEDIKKIIDDKVIFN